MRNNKIFADYITAKLDTKNLLCSRSTIR